MEESLMFGFNLQGEEIYAMNWLVIQAKKFIYQCKKVHKNPNFIPFIQKIKGILRIEKECNKVYQGNRFKHLEKIYHML